MAYACFRSLLQTAMSQLAVLAFGHEAVIECLTSTIR